MYMINDKFPADFVFHVLTTWGMNEAVVSTAAMSPIISNTSIIIGDKRNLF